MKTTRLLPKLSCVWLFVLLLAAVSVVPANAATVTAPSVSTGTYTVTFGNCAAQCWLEESVGAPGSWNYAQNQNNPSYYGGTAQYTGKPAGNYYYHVAEFYFDQLGNYWFVYSPEILVTVYNGPPPTQDTISTQSTYTYETRRGDINGDGLQDLFVRRTSGGSFGNGTIDQLILQNLGNGTFTQFVPNSVQASTAAGWPTVATDLALEDFNLDGFIDVFLNGLGNVISGAVDQIIVAPGQLNNLTPQGLVAKNAKFTTFSNEVGSWIEDPNWYANHAGVRQIEVWDYYYYCDYYGDIYGYVGCFWIPIFIGYTYVPDYSGFDQDGWALASAFPLGANGVPIPTITPGSAVAQTVDTIFQRVFGVRVLRGILATNCTPGTTALSYDADFPIPCDGSLIGDLSLTLVASLTQRGTCRSITGGEIGLVSSQGLYVIRNLDKVKVCDKRFTIFGGGSWITPNGNIYVGPEWTWREDYTAAPVDLRFQGLFIHESVHVYQHNNLGCRMVCIGIRKGISVVTGGYVYMPFDPNKAYFSYNIEQQAELVSDRFRLALGLGTYDTRNNGAQYSQLNNVVPFH